MRSRSRRGSSTLTSRPTSRLYRSLRAAIVGIFIGLAGFYVIAAFAMPDPMVRVVLRSIPVLPVAIWTLWFDRARPFKRQRPALRVAGRVALLVVVMAFAIALLGIVLNWLDDPRRII